MSVSDRHSGITTSHISAIESLMRAENTFLFIRPTEYDTTILIEEGYATKSMDVHHKSSNWGPMAGFVPCDPAFSKICEGKPNEHEHEHRHGKAVPVQLTLTPGLVDRHTKIKLNSRYVLAPNPSTDKLKIPWIVKEKGATPTGRTASLVSRFETAGDDLPEYRFYNADPEEMGNKSTLFCLVRERGEWAVYWVKMTGGGGTLQPLRVFAYSQNRALKPVTGDYDLWMVAPHVTKLDMNQVVKLNKDEHGESAASGYTVTLSQKLNASCGRADNPVFQHGAESQNYDFTQKLDYHFAMFTPGGQSRMVRIDQMPLVLSDLRRAGYLVIWNKRYGEVDPRLSSKADSRGEGALKIIRDELVQLSRDIASIRTAAPESFAPKGPGQMPGKMQAELLAMSNKFQASRNLGLEQSRIYKFNEQLLAFLKSEKINFRVLGNNDFGHKRGPYVAEVLSLHASLEKAMALSTTGKGEMNEGKITEWLRTHAQEIQRLKDYWAIPSGQR